MKKLGYLVLGLGLLAAVALAANNYYQTQQAKQAKLAQVAASNTPGLNSPSTQPKNQTVSKVLAVVNISGFDCPSCPAIAQSAVKNSAGVLDARMTQTGEGSEIIYDSAITNLASIKKSLPDAYKLQLVRQESTTATSLN